MFPILGETLLPGLGTLTGNLPVKLLLTDGLPLEDTDSPGGENRVITARSVEKSQDGSEGTSRPRGAGGESICCCCGGPFSDREEDA